MIQWSLLAGIGSSGAPFFNIVVVGALTRFHLVNSSNGPFDDRILFQSRRHNLCVNLEIHPMLLFFLPLDLLVIWFLFASNFNQVYSSYAYNLIRSTSWLRLGKDDHHDVTHYIHSTKVVDLNPQDLR